MRLRCAMLFNPSLLCVALCLQVVHSCICPSGFVYIAPNCCETRLGFFATCDHELPCPAGSYCDSSQMSLPKACPPGYTCPRTQQIQPNDCGLRNYCPYSSMNMALPCPKGVHMLAARTTDVLCSGSYCDEYNLITPIRCPVGKQLNVDDHF
jgi:hypothetical protein